MNTTVRIMIGSLFVISAVLNLAITEAKHWPDFSCHSYKETVWRDNALKGHRMGWNSCKVSHEKYKQECDKMCVLRSRKAVVRSKKDGPFKFDIEEFITLMLKELGYEHELRKEAPQELVANVTAKLEICTTTYREFETMTNVRYLPCKPYMGLFQCVHNATGCGNDTLLSY